ncbi:hypothetical protein AG1IA_10002 [Rhizoctonia solani AG-1 IA]|uniref:Uncharacterized protein n=1 Tax=Thanatephorus cucumeris (strain AG1-IA) TaxID=983506 RepID=L8WGQ6_THACA|nr:hypothetical protein AG1IA_10002 [Rhizoctonia solani AG-1 IA]
MLCWPRASVLFVYPWTFMRPSTMYFLYLCNTTVCRASQPFALIRPRSSMTGRARYALIYDAKTSHKIKCSEHNSKLELPVVPNNVNYPLRNTADGMVQMSGVVKNITKYCSKTAHTTRRLLVHTFIFSSTTPPSDLGTLPQFQSGDAKCGFALDPFGNVLVLLDIWTGVLLGNNHRSQ